MMAWNILVLDASVIFSTQHAIVGVKQGARAILAPRPRDGAADAVIITAGDLEDVLRRWGESVQSKGS
jgi:hypothetical protein